MRLENVNSEIIQLAGKKKLENRTIVITCKAKLVEARQINQYVEHQTVEACRTGCPNFAKKRSCPPYSNDYENIAKNYCYALLICVYTDMEKYADIKNKYLALKAANVTLKTLVEKMARQLEEELNGYALLSGSCRLCKPCNKKVNMPCKRPEKMRYSMEATHLNVGIMTKENLGHELLWYREKTLPKYTSTVSLVLTNQLVGVSKQKEILETVMESLL